jgi:hypothetical protein
MEATAAGPDPGRALGSRAGLPVLPSVAVLIAVLLLAACCSTFARTTSPSPRPTPGPPPTGSDAPCALPAVGLQILEAAWAYVHERYPTQPWPDTVHLPGDRADLVTPERRIAHVVLCSHATGFVWEGDVAWRARCTCCRIDIDGVRESFVVLSAPDITTSPRAPGDAPAP